MANKEASLLLRIKETGSEVLDRLGDSFDAVKQLGIAAFAAISAVVIKSIDAYHEQEEANNALAQSMVNAGIYSTDLKNKYLEQADALMKLTQFGDEQIVNAQAVLQRYLGQTEVSKELTQATLDLAAAKKMDLASAADLVGKAIGTETNALSRSGIEVTANASQSQKLAEVLDGLNSKFAGQAAAAAEGLGGMKQLSNLVGELFEQIGQRLAPVIGVFVKELKELATDGKSTTGVLEGFVEVIRFAINAGVGVAGVFEAMGKVIGTTLAGALGAVSQLLEGQFKKAFETAKLAMTENGEIIATTYQKTADRMNAIDDAFLAGKKENLDKEEELERESQSKRSAAKEQFEAEEAAKALERQIKQQEIDMQILAASEEDKARVIIQANIKKQQEILKNTTDANKKLAAEQEIYRLNEQQKDIIAAETKKKNMESTLNTIATLQSSNNATLASIGKAAAITEIAIQTPVAIARALAAFPPPFNFAAAGLVGAAMAAQAANIAGVKLAEGGIVMPRAGGTQATIGEAGQAEAVIPLDRMSEFGMGGGGNISVHFYGPVMGDAEQARQFALVLDKELLKLRQNNESSAFEAVI